MDEIIDYFMKWERAHEANDEAGRLEWEEELADYLGCPKGIKMQRLMLVMYDFANNDRA